MDGNLSSAHDALKGNMGNDTEKIIAGAGNVNKEISIGQELSESAAAEQAVETGLREKPGVALNDADSNRVSAQMVKDSTRMLNNNPRNSEM